MTKRLRTEGQALRDQLVRTDPLNRPERIVLIALVTVTALTDFLLFLSTPGADPARTILSVSTTLTFLLFLWSPLAAICVLGIAVTLPFFTGVALAGLLAGAVAALLVFRLGTVPVIFAYSGGFLVANAFFAYGLGGGDGNPANVAVLIVVATVLGALGFTIRLAYVRRRRLEHELAESAEKEREAVLAERRWIAGELHDSIAHHLTIVAMHVQLLDDDALRPTSQDAIRVAARKALSDLRFVIEMAEDAPRGTDVPSGDLTAAVDEAREEFEAAGHPVSCEGDPADERIPRGAEIILARIVRESATNVLKYAGAGTVVIAFELDDESITMTIRSPRPAMPRRDLPSTGTGLNRMAERVLGVRGEFSAGPDGDDWLVSVQLPVASDQTALESDRHAPKI